MKRALSRHVLFLHIVVLLTACSPSRGGMPTPLSEDYVPTVVALTLEASGALAVSPVAAPPTNEPPLPATDNSPSITASATPDPTKEITETPPPSSATPTLIPLLPGWPTPTFPAFIPEARIMILRVGELSKVRSPLQLSVQIGSGAVGPLRLELLGEDGRLLVRQVVALPANFQGPSTEITFKLDFEIAAAAELGRLVLTTQDAFGRLLAVNSVNLVLMSVGEPEINPPTALYEPLVVQTPAAMELVHGGTLILTGVARPDTDKPLRVQLVDEDGRVVGQRLAAVTRDPDGGYGPFAVDVPYSVTSLTPVRVIIYEDGEGISPIVHLTSLEVMLSP